MEMMTMNMMMELDKLPDPFSMPFQEISEFPDIEFSGGSATSAESPPSMLFHSPPPVTTPSLAPIFELSHASNSLHKPNTSSVEAMREMIFRIAAMQPVQIDPESVKPPKRKNVKISKDPQSVAARHRRERISERIRILQRLVPGGTKMDTASMLDEAVHYMKFLKKQVQSLEQQAAGNMPITMGNMGFVGYPTTMNYSPLIKACGQPTSSQMVGNSMHMLR